jgi:hypothetical protein
MMRPLLKAHGIVGFFERLGQRKVFIGSAHSKGDVEGFA